MTHGDREVLFHPAAADSHDRGDLALRVALDPVEAQRALCARRQGGDRPFDDGPFLFACKRFVGGLGGVGTMQGVAFVARSFTQPRAVSCHGPMVRAATIEDEVIGHPEQIGATVSDGPGDRALGLDPQFLDQILGFFAISTARGQETKQFATVEHEQPGEAARRRIAYGPERIIVGQSSVSRQFSASRLCATANSPITEGATGAA